MRVRTSKPAIPYTEPRPEEGVMRLRWQIIEEGCKTSNEKRPTPCVTCVHSKSQCLLTLLKTRRTKITASIKKIYK